LSLEIAREMGLSDDTCEGLEYGALLHDVGKLAVPTDILTRPGRLTDSEYDVVKSHAEHGYDILRSIDFPWPVADIIRQHHERLDGSGYPLGLKGDEICQEARIIGVADVVEAMWSHRPYRAGLGIDAALDELRAGSGTRYDADVVRACEAVIGRGFAFQPNAA
ncbi:MAG: HD-GYP domain-containing protein, partial [Roseicyclus sp.]|nr:HD-GYP domain-containing protein [Roseicyclus sp.]